MKPGQLVEHSYKQGDKNVIRLFIILSNTIDYIFDFKTKTGYWDVYLLSNNQIKRW